MTRSVVYDKKKRQQKEVDAFECTLLQLLDAEYTRHPFYGTRRMTAWLRGCVHAVNRKRVQRLMQKLGLAGMAPGPNTGPFLLNVAVEQRENCFPMMPAGRGHHEIMLSENRWYDSATGMSFEKPSSSSE